MSLLAQNTGDGDIGLTCTLPLPSCGVPESGVTRDGVRHSCLQFSVLTQTCRKKWLENHLALYLCSTDNWQKLFQSISFDCTVSFYDECNYDFHLTDKLTEGKWITQISKREMEWIIDNTYQLPYHMSGTIRKGCACIEVINSCPQLHQLHDEDNWY